MMKNPFREWALPCWRKVAVLLVLPAVLTSFIGFFLLVEASSSNLFEGFLRFPPKGARRTKLRMGPWRRCWLQFVPKAQRRWRGEGASWPALKTRTEKKSPE
uniref:Uncharacterized protein n=1 Tax=Chromera velia CCMP2878 TaxID=1169474 RepID=A0A0G4HB10_9ALVE|eukprot:Cvel_6149.t1-p1 / transcript=Cvel_6149.t1 / gene=Cvel_6149 / organism=Chromera_velia_CCMP2878 / gene_product=hypothetical protein / transcript_product=hypothetical protein / location=Cvel_scaffold297:73982-74284(+) / protein_length=101 / sequence_SO=supercontig / SO=protein_coding / is_pseudo=false